MVKVKFGAILLTCLFLVSCQTSKPATLYDHLGGQEGISAIVDRFIYEISFSKTVVPHFAKSDLDRFRSKMIEQICYLSNGPCEYTGDTMMNVHGGMNITEDEFNQTVDLLINAMNHQQVSLAAQNQLLAILAEMRADIIYH